MNFEQNNLKFNTEVFKNDLKNSLNKYISDADDFDHRTDNEESRVRSNEQIEIEIKAIDSQRDKLASLSVNALKLAENKQAILDMISDIYLKSEEKDFDSILCMERDVLKKIVLELLKK